MSTIYDMGSGTTITDGVQSQRYCNATVQAARRIAAERGHSVIVVDWDAHECYRVTPGGHLWRAPDGWEPDWDGGEKE